MTVLPTSLAGGDEVEASTHAPSGEPPHDGGAREVREAREATEDAEPSVGGTSGAGAAGREPVNILLVDDRPENLLALEAILEPLGERLVRAGSGDEALRHLLVSDFAAILLDVQMPRLSGFETARIIKARERSRHIPIIFLTALNADESNAFRGYEVGAVDYMAKPFQPDVLRSKVAVFVDLYRKQEQLERQQQLLRESERRELDLRHRAELLQSEVRFAQLVDSALDAIVTVEADGTVSLFNAAAERMFGRKAADVIGHRLSELCEEELGLEVLDRMAGHRTGIAGADDDAPPAPLASITGRRAGGELFPAEASVSRLAAGDRVSHTLIVRDVSERQRVEAALRTQAVSLAGTTAKLTALNAELQRRQAELQHAMSARNRFYASMSHELRTPINAIIGYSTLLLDHIYGPLTERQRQGLERSHRAANHLLELVNDVLDLSKIEAGKIELAVQPVAFPGLIDELFVTIGPLADDHGSALTLDSACELTLVTDPRRVRQILLNLLSNAIKFGHGKPIEVTCGAGEDGGLELTVRDHGPGISEADLSRIFDEFVQLPAAAPGSQGTGLGLSISRRLAQLLGGDLTVESSVGEGSTFRLVLPPVASGAEEAAQAGDAKH
ncbi:MAG TPA: ATP-binding protein [Gemmatimonadales bacterium]